MIKCLELRSKVRLVYVLVLLVFCSSILIYSYKDSYIGSVFCPFSEPSTQSFLVNREDREQWWRQVLCKGRSDGTGKPLKKLFRNVSPAKDNNVFLLDTACNSDPKYRVWCSVESWARQNPDRQVWFLLTSGKLVGKHDLTSTLLHDYTNLNVMTADLYDLFTNTPLLPLFKSRKWATDDTWPVELLSDMLRVLVLWWWGGVYSDTDVVSLRPLTLPPNSLGFENPSQLGSSFYSFQAHHPALQHLMKDMAHNFKAWEWGSIGPKAITRVMTELCKSSMSEVFPKTPITCWGNITLHPVNVFSPVPYQNFNKYFKSGGGKDFDQTYKAAFGLHFWNKMSKKWDVKVNSTSVYEVVAKRSCPITFKIATKHSDVF